MNEEKENIKQETEDLKTEEQVTDVNSDQGDNIEEKTNVESDSVENETASGQTEDNDSDSSNNELSEEKSANENMGDANEVNPFAKFILGTKVGMTSIYSEDGQQFPATVIEAGPCYVSQIKNDENDGYNAVQIGYIFDKKANKPKTNHFKKNNCEPLKFSKEYRTLKDDKFTLGEKIDVNIFSKGEFVSVTGTSKGKGFAGVMKRHGFGGGRASHGKNSVMRKPGSVGAGSDPSRIWKGKKMPGRYGGDQVTVENLEIIKVDIENNLLFIKGAVPGSNNNLVSITF